jgi:hypothetical protein
MIGTASRFELQKNNVLQLRPEIFPCVMTGFSIELVLLFI